MSRERLDFRRRQVERRPGSGRLPAMVVLLALVGALLVFRQAWEPRVDPGVLVEVVGEVPRPGMHLIDEPTLAEAVRAAGGESGGLSEQLLHEGDRVVVGADGVHVSPAGNPLLVALPIDVNTADSAALEAVPGIGPALAARIVADREENGPFAEVGELVRVHGIGPATVERTAPFLTAGAVERSSPR